MASLSLPRVLQLKKNSLDAEREQFEKFQTLAIQKATNAVETPVKEKHVRSTIIGTFQEQSAVTYWMVAVRLPLQDNRIVAWKFCHVTHKLLREGHPACLDDSQRHITMIQNLGKLWVHLREGYGRLVHLYCALLVCKLKFHARNPRFPGNMQLTADELDAIAENDVNNYFQLCVELFDYMDDILNLQAAVFDSLGNARANSMTASGQCRLAALIPCAQDSSQIYDCNVRLLFRLHAALPPDTLAGHRERFRQQFKKLSSFYKHASSLQYYRNLLTLPLLPSNPPNFLIQSDFGTYVPPVVSIPEPQADEVDAVGSLIDTSDTISVATTPEQMDVPETRATPSPQPDPVVERDRLIDHLQNELRRMRLEVSQLVQEKNSMIGSMREHCSRIETQLQNTKTELEEQRQKAEIIAAETPEIMQKLTQTEEKAKVQDEKFQKLKGAYTQLREEHITLIRQKAEVDKTAASLRSASAQHESAKMALQQQLNDRMKDVELLQQSASSSEEIEAYKSQIASLRSELERSREKETELETLRASMEALDIEHKTTTTVQAEKLTALENELKEAIENLETVKKENEEKDAAVAKVKEELVGLREKSGDEYRKVVEERETALKQVADLTQQHLQEKQELNDLVSNLKTELESSQQKILETDTNYKNYTLKLNDESNTKNQQYEQNLSKRDEELKEALEGLAKLEQDKTVAVTKLKLQLENILNEKDGKINEIQDDLEEKLRNINLLNNECESLKENIANLEAAISDKTNEINDLNAKLEESQSILQNQKVECDNQLKESQTQIDTLKEDYKQLAENTQDIITGLKSHIAEKDEQVISFNIEVNNLKDNISKLEEAFSESEAELEISKNELLQMREEHEAFVERNDRNLCLKNEEFRTLHDEINKLKSERTKLVAENKKNVEDLDNIKQVYENRLKEFEENNSKRKNDYETLLNENLSMTNNLNDEIANLKQEQNNIVERKDHEIKSLHVKIEESETDFKTQISERENMIMEANKDNEELKVQLEELQSLRAKEKENMELMISERENKAQSLEGRLEHSERRRLSAECELQDLLQHNSLLEADLTAARIQLREAQAELEKERLRLVTVTGAAALQVARGALEPAEPLAAADAAAAALRALADTHELKGHEEAVARAAVLAAHGAAQLAAQAADAAGAATDGALADGAAKQRVALDADGDDGVPGAAGGRRGGRRGLRGGGGARARAGRGRRRRRRARRRAQRRRRARAHGRRHRARRAADRGAAGGEPRGRLGREAGGERPHPRRVHGADGGREGAGAGRAAAAGRAGGPAHAPPPVPPQPHVDRRAHLRRQGRRVRGQAARDVGGRSRGRVGARGGRVGGRARGGRQHGAARGRVARARAARLARAAAPRARLARRRRRHRRRRGRRARLGAPPHRPGYSRHVGADADGDAAAGDGEQGPLAGAGDGAGRGARAPVRAARAPLPAGAAAGEQRHDKRPGVTTETTTKNYYIFPRQTTYLLVRVFATTYSQYLHSAKYRIFLENHVFYIFCMQRNIYSFLQAIML